MKKVLFVATVVRLHLNMFHKPFLKWFHDQGWQVDVAANNDYQDPAECQIPNCDHFYCLPFDRSPLKKGNLDAYRQLKQLLQREHYDIIHCHTPMGGVAARLAGAAARKTGTKVIYTAHGFHFFRGAPVLNWLVYYPIERSMARKTDLLITINGEDYRRASGFRVGWVEQVNGVGLDLGKFQPMEDRERAAVRAELGLQPEDTFVISVGQLVKGKNHQTSLRALALLDDPHIHLVIPGDGPLGQELTELARELGVEKQLHLLGFRRDVYRLCGAADLFLFPSLREGLPVAVMEAMACGLPIVASTTRGIVDLLGDGKGGILLDAQDAAGIADAMKTILQDPRLRAQMGANNLEAVQKYSTEAVVEQMARLYESMM